MRATARVVAACDQHGATRVPVLRSESPLVLRTTTASRPRLSPGATVHLVGAAAGPLGGDDLLLEVEVGPGAALCLRTVAASVALPGAAGAPSRLQVQATVASGGRLVWLPEPLVAAAGCDHQAHSRLALADGARVSWRDEIVCGRHGEPPGDAVTSLAVTYADRPLLHQDLAVGPRAPGWDAAAVLGDARAAGTLLRVEPDWGDAPPRPQVPTAARQPPAGSAAPCAAAASTPLAGPGVVTTAVGPDTPTVRRLLTAAWQEETSGEG